MTSPVLTIFYILIPHLLFNLIHQRVIIWIKVLISVNTHAVHIDCQQQLGLHHLLSCIIGQFNIEETCIRLGQRLVALLLVHHRLYHEPYVVALELLAVDR